MKQFYFYPLAKKILIINYTISNYSMYNYK